LIVNRTVALDIRVEQQQPFKGKEAAVFVAKKSGGGSTFCVHTNITLPELKLWFHKARGAIAA